VPPITAAATDGSSWLSTRVTLAVLLRPAYTKPAMPANRLAITYSTIRTCHDLTPDSRAATGLSPIAYSSRPYPVRWSPNRITSARGTNTTMLAGINWANDDAPMVRNSTGTPAPVWTR
jgi:hypothetical protein